MKEEYKFPPVRKGKVSLSKDCKECVQRYNSLIKAKNNAINWGH